MCRWFAYVSEDEECLLEDVLIEPVNSIMQQVEHHYLPYLVPHDPTNIAGSDDKTMTLRNSLYNMDGMGMAWYTHAQEHYMKGVSGIRPALYKSISPPLNDFNFRNLCTNTASKVVFAHIRATSGSPVCPPNNHPFVFGRHTFMHNGVVSDFTTIRRDFSSHIGADEFANIMGSTDSEHMAAMYMTILTKGQGKAAWEEHYPLEEMANAMERVLALVVETQMRLLPGKNKPNSLNLAATDGHQLVSCRFRNHATEQPPSLYYSTTAGITLNRKYPGHHSGKEYTGHSKKAEEHGSHVIVASEPTTMHEKEWELIPANTLLMVDKKGKTGHRKVKYDQAWNANDN